MSTNFEISREGLPASERMPFGGAVIIAMITNTRTRYLITYNTKAKDDGDSELIYMYNMETKMYAENIVSWWKGEEIK